MSGKSLFAVVLAAGASRRFGATKQLATYDGMALVARAMRCAEAVCGNRSVLVTGNDWQSVAAACEPLAGFMVCNTEYRDGLAGSICAGVGAVRESASAVMLTLADQPLVTPTHLGRLAARWRTAPDHIVASGYAGTVGPPVIFPHHCFADLMALRGDSGARQVIDANRDRLIVIDYEAAATDIDRPEDLERL